ncbi:MAG: hypothetical protein ACR2I2_13800 [Bryobacteraceae bacterium]
MPLFAVLGYTALDKLEAAIKLRYPNDHFSFTADQWFVRGEGTAKDVSDAIGIGKRPDGTEIPGVVIFVGGYFGLAPTNLWEWFLAKPMVKTDA